MLWLILRAWCEADGSYHHAPWNGDGLRPIVIRAESRPEALIRAFKIADPADDEELIAVPVSVYEE